MGYKFLCEVSASTAAALTTITSILLILAGLASIAIIIAVLMQPSNPDGGKNVITGTNDSYYAQNRGSTKEGRLKKIIITCAVIILVVTIAFFVIRKFFPA